MISAIALTEMDLDLGLRRNGEALVSVMDGLADEVDAWGFLDMSEPTMMRLSRLLQERGSLRSRLHRRLGSAA